MLLPTHLSDFGIQNQFHKIIFSYLKIPLNKTLKTMYNATFKS